ncbi:MAG: hypothetical protein EZS28_010842 [Streblomastix strix]|uniref:Uncharacterized protein n=1 Tax=Streblomastix strix TaxID=222440 RepID=A0A5J4WF72_9EUKA|nr:MAG: hypothetical protein EZS28_010842 [Streblomastix strix]
MVDSWGLPEVPLPVLSRARVNVNVQRTNDPLRFILDGDRMVQAFFAVKIIELRDKTEEEIKLEKEMNKELWEKYNPKKSNSKSSKQQQIIKSHEMKLKNQNLIIQQQEKFQQLPSYHPSNSTFVSLSPIRNIVELPRDETGLVIWPPENSTPLPFLVGAQIQSKQQAQFIMQDYSWLNNRQKWYAELISNDRKIFSGSEGEIDAAVLLEVEIEEGEQFLNFEIIADDEIDDDTKINNKFPWWIILLIVLLVVALAAVIAILLHKEPIYL